MKKVGSKGAPRAHSRAWAPWTDEEKRYLVTHKADGYALMAHVLGRTEKAIRRQAEKMGVRARRAPELGELCPICGEHRVRSGTRAARVGICPLCWEREKTDAMAERARTLEQRRRYDAAKKSIRVSRRMGAEG